MSNTALQASVCIPDEPPGGLDERFCEVMDAAPVMIWVSGKDKLCTWFNKPWLSFTGRGMSEEVGNGWAEGVHPDDFAQCLDIYVRHFDARLPFRMQYRLRRADGEFRWIDDIGIPRQARDGTFLGFIGSCTDIHEQRELQGVIDAARELRHVVGQTPFILARIGKDLRFKFVSDSCAVMLRRRPEEIVGKTIEELFGSTAFAEIRAYVERVLGGDRVEFERRFALDKEERYLHVVYTPERGETGDVIGWIASIIDITDRKRAEDTIRTQRDRAALLSQTVEDLLAAKDPDTIVQDLLPRVARHVDADAFFNFMVDESGKALRLHACAGIGEREAQSIRTLDYGQAICGRVALQRSPIHATDIQNRNDDASALVRAWGIQAYCCNPLLAGDELLGTLSFASRTRAEFQADEVDFFRAVAQHTAIAIHRLRSEAALRESEERMRLLLGEVNHRSKNMLALVQTVARQTAKRGSDDFIGRFERRIQALSASQDLLVRSEWKGVGLEDLLRSQLAHFHDLVGTRISWEGPPVRLTASAAQALGMAFHELATNAGKYGALSNETGRVTITWGNVDGPSEVLFSISWIERGGPNVVRPTRQGFGSTVLDRIVTSSLSASVTLDYAPEGLTWRLVCRDPQAIGGGSEPAPFYPQDGMRASGSLRVLVVEDEPLIALEMAHVLEQADYVVVGPAHSVGRGLELLDQVGCDCAVLDINLGSETAEPIAMMLKKKGVPFLTVSGYARAQQPASFRDAPFLPKPVSPEQLIAELRRCVASAASQSLSPAAATVPA